MKDKNKTKEQLLDELVKLRQRIAELEKPENERKRDEEALRESEERLHTVISNAPIIMWALDKEGIFTLSEGKGLKALGLKPGAVVGQSVFDVYRDEPKILEDNRRALAGKSFVSIVEVGELVYESHYSPVWDENGEVIGMIGVSTDITERKRAEMELRKYKTISDKAGYGSSISDLKGNLLYVNESFEKMHGYTADELIGKNMSILHTEDQMKNVNRLREQLKKKNIYVSEEVWHRRKDKSVFPASMNATLIRDEKGNPLFMAATTVDITKRKWAEEVLEQKIRQQEVLLSAMPVFVYFKDTELRLIAANKAFAEIINTPVDQLVGKTAYDLFPKEQAKAFHADDKKVMESGKVIMNIEEEFTDAYGKKRWASTSKVPYFNENKKVVGMVGITTDITERKVAEEKIKAALKEKEVMLKEIHHRVKNNMQIISSLLKLQFRETKSKKMQEMLRTSQSRIRSMALIHERLYQSKDFTRIDFTYYIQSLTVYLFHSYRVNTNIVRLKTDVRDVHLDINRAIPCGLIVNELVSNSLKHAFPGGREGEI
ncbi:MAG: PAS domain S-box protein, partial [Candidatus Aminicenantes bacterium]|nr:PAS domain S-box protein [Candidatus Aminicenantes bacterium]